MTGQKHKTVRVRVGRRQASIDTKLAPLIRLLWEADISTEFCCQEAWSGLAEIAFLATFDVEEFMNVAQRHYQVRASSWVVEDRNGKRAPFHRVLLSVTFPAQDIPYLIKAWTTHLANPA